MKFAKARGGDAAATVVRDRSEEGGVGRISLSINDTMEREAAGGQAAAAVRLCGDDGSEEGSAGRLSSTERDSSDSTM